MEARREGRRVELLDGFVMGVKGIYLYLLFGAVLAPRFSAAVGKSKT